MFVDSGAGEVARVTRHVGAHRGDATIVILRPDRTTRARVSLQLGEEGWSRYTSETCGNEPLVRWARRSPNHPALHLRNVPVRRRVNDRADVRMFHASHVHSKTSRSREQPS
jgi:hypothetical protein